MEYRKVTFKLRESAGFKYQASEAELADENEQTRERKGYFHCWIPDLYWNPEIQKNEPTMNALVEDAETGKLHSLSHRLITFEPLRAE